MGPRQVPPLTVASRGVRSQRGTCNGHLLHQLLIKDGGGVIRFGLRGINTYLKMCFTDFPAWNLGTSLRMTLTPSESQSPAGHSPQRWILLFSKPGTQLAPWPCRENDLSNLVLFTLRGSWHGSRWLGHTPFLRWCRHPKPEVLLNVE